MVLDHDSVVGDEEQARASRLLQEADGTFEVLGSDGGLELLVTHLALDHLHRHVLPRHERGHDDESEQGGADTQYHHADDLAMRDAQTQEEERCG